MARIPTWILEAAIVSRLLRNVKVEQSAAKVENQAKTAIVNVNFEFSTKKPLFWAMARSWTLKNHWFRAASRMLTVETVTAARLWKPYKTQGWRANSRTTYKTQRNNSFARRCAEKSDIIKKILTKRRRLCRFNFGPFIVQKRRQIE